MSLAKCWICSAAHPLSLSLSSPHDHRVTTINDNPAALVRSPEDKKERRDRSTTVTARSGAEFIALLNWRL